MREEMVPVTGEVPLDRVGHVLGAQTFFAHALHKFLRELGGRKFENKRVAQRLTFRRNNAKGDAVDVAQSFLKACVVAAIAFDDVVELAYLGEADGRL